MEVSEVPLLSTGQPSTLGVWRDLSALVFGEHSSPVELLDGIIAKVPEGRDGVVGVPEGPFLNLLGQMFVKDLLG